MKYAFVYAVNDKISHLFIDEENANAAVETFWETLSKTGTLDVDEEDLCVKLLTWFAVNAE